MQTVFLNSFRFDINGLQFNYTKDGETFISSFDALATCNLFTEHKLIEGFDIDKNCEPVILFTDRTYPEGFGFDMWASFVHFFPVSYKIAAKILEMVLAKAQFDQDMQTIDRLLSPLQKAS
jgi:hypothetical protein